MGTAYAAEIHTKTPNGVRFLDMDFADDIATGDTLTGTPTIVEITTTDLTLDTKTFSGTVCQAKCSGGTDGENYVIRYQIGTTNGETLEAFGRLEVRDV